MISIYVSDPVHDDVLTSLAQNSQVYLGFGAAFVDYDEVCDQVDAVLLRAENFDADRIARSPRLRIIARHGVGTDNVDIDAATAAGIWVTTTPGSNSRAVAEHVFALMLSLARHTPLGVAQTSAGHWGEAKARMHGLQLHGRTLGLLGFGNIARLVNDIAQGLGMRVLVHDPFVNPDAIAASNAETCDFQTLIGEAHVLSLHLPLTAQTRHVLNADTLTRLRPETLIINTSRGGLIDETALAKALTDGQLGGAALDVLEAEQIDMADPLSHAQLPIGELPNLLVTPHVAGLTDEAFRNAGTAALRSITQVLSGQAPDDAVNHPTTNILTH